MADDACSAVKADLEAGTYTNYKVTFPIYIHGKDVYEGGPTYILLDGAWKDPTQTVDGTVLYNKRGCNVIIRATSQEIRDQIYDDVEAILTATNRGYKLKRARDRHFNPELNRTIWGVEMLL